MNKISGYKVTNSGARRIVLFTMETLQPNRMWTTTEVVYSYGPREPMPQRDDEDAWQYTLPTGETYTHPNKHGCLHMILQDAIGELGPLNQRKPKVEPFVKTHG